MREDIIILELKIEAKTEKQFKYILEDAVRSLIKLRNIFQEGYYIGGGFLRFYKQGNSDTFRKNLLMKKF